MSKYEELIVMDAVLRTKLDEWRDAAHHAVDMAEHHSRLAMEAGEAGDKDEALRQLELCLEWAKKL